MIDVEQGFKLAAINGVINTELMIRVFDTEQINIFNNQIVSESMTITQALCDDSKIRFGGCISGSFEIDLSYPDDLSKKYITVMCMQTAIIPTYPGAHLYPGVYTSGEPWTTSYEYRAVYPAFTIYKKCFALFSGDVFSCKLAKNKLTRHLIAYDRFYWRGSIDCTAFYNSLYANAETITLAQLRTAILTQYDLRQAEIVRQAEENETDYDYTAVVPLPADNFLVYKMDTDSITVGDILRMIAEFNGVFMRMDGLGNIEYISIGDSTAGEPEIYEFYADAQAEDFTDHGYDCFDTHSIGVYDIIPNSNQERPYDLDNPLVTTGYVQTILEPGTTFSSAFNAVKSAIAPNFQYTYRPMELKVRTWLWVQPGDRVRFVIKWYSIEGEGENEHTVTHVDTINSIILSRRITGIQAMTDELTAQGEV